jgi:hypothetical protein
MSATHMVVGGAFSFLMSLLPCEEKLRLLVEYQKLVQVYSAAIAEMSLAPNSHVDDPFLREATNKARHASQAARQRLEQHIAEHGC